MKLWMVFHILQSRFHTCTLVSPATFLSGIQWDIDSLSSSNIKLISGPLNGGLGQHGEHLARGLLGWCCLSYSSRGPGAALSLPGHLSRGGKAACRFKYS